MNLIFGYPLMSWLPIALMFIAIILNGIDRSRPSEKGRAAAIRKIIIGLCLVVATILTFIFRWQERWIMLFVCILASDKLFSGIKMLKYSEPQS